MQPPILQTHSIVLASRSPRRQELIKQLELPFEVIIKEDVEEIYSKDLSPLDVPEYLACLKAKPYISDLATHKWLVITADTIVLCENQILGKPKNRAEAYGMLCLLSGKWHEVITGVALTCDQKQHTFSSSTKVFFKPLSDDEIYHYIDRYKPYDKAGAYGIQEWIGMVAIEMIEGSYFNVVGLPVQKLYAELMAF